MAPASDNVWVGDLPFGMDKGTLANLFEAYGTVVECRILPGRDESSKPAAMIRFGSVDMATWVVENLNGNMPEGVTEPIVCRFANAKGDKGGGKGDFGGQGKAAGPYGGGGGGSWDKGGGGGGKAGFVPPSPSDNVWIGDLPVGCEKNDLATVFEAYGTIQDCRILPGRDPAAKPCAMIRFASVEMATWVVENLNGNIPQGLAEPIIARFANSGGASKGGAKGGDFGGGGKAGGFGGKGGDFGGGKGGKGGPKGKKGGAPGSFQALMQSVKGAGLLGGGTVADECQCYVRNLPRDTTDLDLYKLFSPFGSIPPTGVKAMKNEDGSCKGFGFVDLTDPTAAATAVMSLDGHTLPDGSCLQVSAKQAGKGGGKGKGKDMMN